MALGFSVLASTVHLWAVGRASATVTQACARRFADRLDGELDDPAGERAAIHDDFSDRYGQREPARPGASGIEVKDAA